MPSDAPRFLTSTFVHLFDEVGLTGHPKAEKVFSRAWENGHSSGYGEVYNYAVDYAELVL